MSDLEVNPWQTLPVARAADAEERGNLFEFEDAFPFAEENDPDYDPLDIDHWTSANSVTLTDIRRMQDRGSNINAGVIAPVTPWSSAPNLPPQQIYNFNFIIHDPQAPPHAPADADGQAVHNEDDDARSVLSFTSEQELELEEDRAEGAIWRRSLISFERFARSTWAWRTISTDALLGLGGRRYTEPELVVETIPLVDDTAAQRAIFDDAMRRVLERFPAPPGCEYSRYSMRGRDEGRTLTGLVRRGDKIFRYCLDCRKDGHRDGDNKKTDLCGAPKVSILVVATFEN